MRNRVTDWDRKNTAEGIVHVLCVHPGQTLAEIRGRFKKEAAFPKANLTEFVQRWGKISLTEQGGKFYAPLGLTLEKMAESLDDLGSEEIDNLSAEGNDWLRSVIQTLWALAVFAAGPGEEEKAPTGQEPGQVGKMRLVAS